MRTTIPLALVLFVSLAAPAAAEPTTATTTTTASLEQTVSEHMSLAQNARTLVRLHFTALAEGDRAGLASLWSPSAEVTSRAGKTTTVTPIRQALRRWIAAREGLTWTIEDAGVLAEGSVWVVARVTWNGASYRDILLAARGERGLQLVGKHAEALIDAGPSY